MYGSVVLGVDHHRFEEIIEHVKLDAGVVEDTQLAAADWHRVVRRLQGNDRDARPESRSRRTPRSSCGARSARCSASWMNPRANTYRRLHDIPASWGTAVNVQAMVFGNMGEDCATGVCFTRDPSTGENVFYGEYPGQRAGRGRGGRHPHAAADVQARRAKRGEVSHGGRRMPEAYAELLRVRAMLEKHYKRHAGHRVHRAAATRCTCCRRATASAPRRRGCASPWRWRTRG